MVSDRIDVSVVSSGHDVADARLHRIVEALTRAGLQVELFGLGDAAWAPNSVRAHTREQRSLAGRAADALSGPWRARGRIVLIVDPDLIPAAMARRVTGRRVVVDVHEDYGRLAADRSWSQGALRPVVRLGADSVNAWAARADLVVVADDHLPPHTARERMVVRNLPDFSHLPEPSERDATPRAIYVGDVRASRGLFAMLDAVEAADPWELDIVGPLAAADREEVERRLAASDLVDRVRMHGRMPPALAWGIARGAWLGLSMLESTPAFVEAIPTKVYEYLACGLPVLGTDLPRQRELLEAEGAGVIVADPNEAAALMRSWVVDTRELAEMAQAAVAWSERTRNSPSEYDALAARIKEWLD